MSREQTTHIDLSEDEIAGAGAAGDTVINDLVQEDGVEGVVDEDQDLAGALPKRAKRNDDGSVTLPLRYPVTLRIRSSSRGERSESYKELTFHRLNGAAIRAVQATSPATLAVVLLAKSARVTDPVMNVLYDKMDGADIADAMVVVEGFLGNGQTNRK